MRFNKPPFIRFSTAIAVLPARLILLIAVCGVADGSTLVAADEAKTQPPAATPPTAPAVEASPNVTSSALDVPSKVLRYLEYRFRQLDKNGDGRLERDEWQAMQPLLAAADADANGILTRKELMDRVFNYGRARRLRVLSSPNEGPANTPADDATPDDPAASGTGDPAADNASGENAEQPKETAISEKSKSKPRRDTRFFVPTPHLPQGIPEWWRDRDANGDGQLSLREFAPQASATDVAAFKKLDINNDGVLTGAEYVRGASAKKPDAPKQDAAKPDVPKSPAGG